MDMAVAKAATMAEGDSGALHRMWIRFAGEQCAVLGVRCVYSPHAIERRRDEVMIFGNCLFRILF